LSRPIGVSVCWGDQRGRGVPPNAPAYCAELNAEQHPRVRKHPIVTPVGLEIPTIAARSYFQDFGQFQKVAENTDCELGEEWRARPQS
jgi:hypothetical protein